MPASKPFCTVAIAFTSLVLALSLNAETPKDDPSTEKKVSFYKEVRPIFQARCHGCHQPAKARGKYIMTSFDQLLKGGDSEEIAITPSAPGKSQLIKLITPVDGEAEMPDKGDPLHQLEIELITRWIAQGAIDDTPANARQRFDMEHPPVYSRPPIVTSLDFSPDGTLLAVSGFHEVLLHEGDGSGPVARLVGLSERIESVRFSPDGKKLAVTGGLPGRMGEVQVWDVGRRKLELSVPVTHDTVYGASWSPDGKLIAFGCSDNSVRVIDAASGEQVLFNAAHNDWVFDTIFSTNGSHVVAVGRDMTAKLVEVSTQRFIDNLTSITPAALKGGLAAVDRHPSRDEILVGGADGIPQIYRTVRQTKRVIGDNANLIRLFPSMPGRIFDVAYSPDGQQVVAGSSLNGKGYLHIYSSIFDSSIPDPVKKAFEKEIGGRTPEDQKTITDYQTADVKLTAQTTTQSGIFSVAFHPDGKTIAAAGADGAVLFLDAATASILRAFVPVPLPAEWQNQIIALTLNPSEIRINGNFSYHQLLVNGWLPSGDVIDLTRIATKTIDNDAASLSSDGMLRALRNGSAQLTLSHQGLQLAVPVTVEGIQEVFKPIFARDVAPVISKLGCNAGTCHGSKDGRNGFKLSLRGYDHLYDVRAFADDLAARRVNFASPDDSLMLLKATGAVPHEGGQRTTVDSDYYRILRDWIGDGCQLETKTPRVTSIEVNPRNPVIQAVGTEQQMRVVATYSDGSLRDVTAEAFIESGLSEVAKATGTGLITSVRRGEAPILARFEGAYAATTVTVMGDRSGFVWKEPETFNRIDEFTAEKWHRMKILPSELCSDTEFLRRIHLDLTGLPPTVDKVRSFLDDKRPSREKREALIDELIGSDDYVELMANKWADLLQVNSKFLGPEGAAAFRGWIREEIKNNTPYNEFAHKILTAAGSNKDNPPASYFKVLRTPADTMENTTHLFLATRFNCNKCHDHPFERWTQDQYYETAAFFAQTGLKDDPASDKKRIGGTAVEGSKAFYEIVFDKTDGEITHDRTGEIAPPRFPFPAKTGPATANPSRREQLAQWITSSDNPYFARSYVNRIWGYLTGVGLIEPLDDIRAGNPPSNPELLNWLTTRFIDGNFDVRELVRTICKSRTYQLSVRTHRWNEDDTINFSHATPRRLPAEVLYDALYAATGTESKFPGVPAGTRAAQLPDVGIKLADGFLGNLGRPPRESACECERSNDIQLGPIMALVTGPTVDTAISAPDNAIAKLVDSESDNRKVVNELYLRVLNRPATEDEITRALEAFDAIEPEHQQLLAEVESYRKELQPLTEEKEKRRQHDVADARAEVAAYEEEIAPREMELDRKQQEAIASAEEALGKYNETLPAKTAEWEKGSDRATTWVALDPKDLKASNGATLTREEDLSIFASGPNGKGSYTISAETSLSGITGVKLELFRDERLPKNGPGRASDGNFVLTEFSLTSTPSSDETKTTPVELHKAMADFSQNDFEVASAVDGKTPDNKGWASHPKLGENRNATFELKTKLEGDGTKRLTFTLNQSYSGNEFSIGRFRLNVTTSEKVDFGLPEQIHQILELAAVDRSEEQQKALRDYFRSRDEEAAKLDKALAEAKKQRPTDPKLLALRSKLERVEKPVPPDPGLTELERASALSVKQLEKQRLVAAQDITWALVNNPAFLFNY